MITYLSPRIRERFQELMEMAEETMEGLATRVHNETGMNPNWAYDLIKRLRHDTGFNHRKPQAQVRANQISLIYGVLNVPENDAAVMLMREECAKLGLQFEYPLPEGRKLRVTGVARDPDSVENPANMNIESSRGGYS